MAGVGLNLATLYFQDLQYQQSGSTSGFVPNLTQANIPTNDVSGTNVNVLVSSESTTVSQLQSSLQALGMQVTLTTGNLIGGWLPISQIQNAALTHGLVSAAQATVAKTDTKSLGVVAAPQNPSVVTAPINQRRCERRTVSICCRTAVPAKPLPSSTLSTTRRSLPTPMRSVRRLGCRNSTRRRTDVNRAQRKRHDLVAGQFAGRR